MWLKYEFFPKGGGGGLDQTKSFEALFFASKPPKGGEVRGNPKVLRQF